MAELVQVYVAVQDVSLYWCVLCTCVCNNVCAHMGIWACRLGVTDFFLGKMKKMKCKPVHREVSCLKFAEYRVTDSCLLNIVSVHAMRVSVE